MHVTKISPKVNDTAPTNQIKSRRSLLYSSLHNNQYHDKCKCCPVAK